MSEFHSEEYLHVLMHGSTCSLVELARYGLTDDCPWFVGVDKYVAAITGATLRACDVLKSGEKEIAINWFGGWHHAKASTAEGFCYVNDCVLAALSLCEVFSKVLYIDIDAHHCNGVQDAFYSSPDVFVLSFHHYAKGFFPGTGSAEQTGAGRGKFCNMNILIPEGVTDDLFLRILLPTVSRVASFFKPNAIILQSGVDLMARDVGLGNLTPQLYIQAVSAISSLKLPLLILGGGGYVPTQFAKCLTLITASLLELNLPATIPEWRDSVDDTYLEFMPDFSMKITSIQSSTKVEYSFQELESFIKLFELK